MVRRILKIVAFVVVAIGLLIIFLIGPIDRSPLNERPFYNRMQQRLDSIQPEVFTATNVLSSGWSKVNITPRHPMPMAGYSPRNTFESVHDSLYARILRITNGSVNIAFVNVDLLLFPTLIKKRIEEKLDSLGSSNFLYLSATHTHNGVGGWDNSIAGRIAFGTFDGSWVEKTATDIAVSIASVRDSPSRLSYWQADASELVENRIDRENGETDGILRGIRIVRDDSSRAILFTFSAHPTSIEKDSHALSADYPGSVIGKLEETSDFGMFMAGMVGSHRFVWMPQTGFEFIDHITPVLGDKIATSVSDSTLTTPVIQVLRLPIEFGKAQPRISKNWKIRDWVVRTTAHPLRGEATVVQIGNVMFIGLPCDFSGEIFKQEKIDELAAESGKHVIITSFNGEYNGYITWDQHYEVGTVEEVSATNWVGPGFGKYFTEIISAIITHDAEKPKATTEQ